MKTVIEWQKYPKEKPFMSGTYLVTVFDKQEKQTFVITDSYIGGIWLYYNNGDYKVKAWAKLPEPFKE